ncbi:MAG: DMT family transporter [Gemmataceae bacterium]|nr:DMT family transporter [Gemmataceae bacterium]
MNTATPAAGPSLRSGRCCILLAALLWSTSGAFAKVLTQPTPIGADQPPIEALHWLGKDFPVQIACYRALFAGLVLLLTVRRGHLSFRPSMLGMAVCFALMNFTFISAQALGTAANAIFLQYSAPLWMYLAAVCFLGESGERRGTVALTIGMIGIGVIIAGGWQDGELLVVVIGLASGVTYAAVLIFLRVLRAQSANWLTAWNHLLGAAALAPMLLWLRPPTLLQLAVLFLFGAGQMGLAYWLVARGLRVVGAQEAGTLTLLEPLLNPVWAYLIAGEIPAPETCAGGALIIGALAWRYWPWRDHGLRHVSA